MTEMMRMFDHLMSGFQFKGFSGSGWSGVSSHPTSMVSVLVTRATSWSGRADALGLSNLRDDVDGVVLT